MNDEKKPLSWESVDRLDWHLWLLTIILLLVLGVSLLGFMFPTAFWFGQDTPLESPQRAFFAFCVLLALVLVYLMQRQSAVRRLKRELFEAQLALRTAEQDAAIQIFLSLPERPQFRDALAMEFRRASASGAHLSEVAFKLAGGSRQELALLVSSLRTLLRRGESMFRIGERGIVVILPNAPLATAASFAAQVEHLVGLGEDCVRTRVSSYPEDVSTLTELEGNLMNEDDRWTSVIRK
jgi:GGDEF domain-containing protein